MREVDVPPLANIDNAPEGTLGVLGYGGNEIAAALKGLDIQNLSVEDIVRQGLKKLMK